jgi:lipoate-protein ligase A
MKWRLLETGISGAAVNMAVDEAILLSCIQGEAPPTLRFYGWRPAAVSVGYFQSMLKEVDVEACKRLGIDYVRRHTGGRAVLHDVELTYSVVMPERTSPLPEGLLGSYRVISEAIQEGLGVLGVETTIVSSKSGNRTRTGSAACFNISSRHELAVGGRKVVGSAQLRRGNTILQHGSIPLDLDANRLFTVLKIPVGEQRGCLIQQARERMTGLRQILGRAVTFAELAQALETGWKRRFETELVPGELSPQERECSEKLARKKYSSREWNFLR